MRKTALVAVGFVEYVFTLVITSCFMMAVWRWVLNPNHCPYFWGKPRATIDTGRPEKG